MKEVLNNYCQMVQWSNFKFGIELNIYLNLLSNQVSKKKRQIVRIELQPINLLDFIKFQILEKWVHTLKLI